MKETGQGITEAVVKWRQFELEAFAEVVVVVVVDARWRFARH